MLIVNKMSLSQSQAGIDVTTHVHSHHYIVYAIQYEIDSPKITNIKLARTVLNR